MDQVQGQNTQKPFFTIVILVTDFEHLLSLTMDSILAQTCKDYEIVLVEAKAFSKIEHILQSYPEVSIDLHVEDEMNQSILMNRGLSYAKGEYVHYLYCGDVYLSQQSLAYVKEMSSQYQSPDLLYCGYIIREKEELPSAVIKPLSFEMLRKGEIPTAPQCCWYSKKALEAQKGFSEKYFYRPVLYLFCNLIKQNSKIVFLPRILVDYITYRRQVRVNLLYMSETFSIVFKHFGIWRALSWWFVQDHIRTLKIAFRVLRKAFWGT